MPLFDEAGKEVEGALTAEEVNAKLEEAGKEATEKVTNLESDLAKTKKDFEELSKKDINFEKTREQITTLEKALEEAKAESGKKTEEMKSAKISTAIKKYTGDDQELFDKVKKEFDGFEGEPETDEALTERVVKAFTLATGAAPKDEAAGDAFKSGGGNAPIVDNEGTDVGKLDDPAVAEVGKKLGLKDEDMKKHGLI